VNPLIDRIKDRCVMCGDCWLWRGYALHGDQPQIKIDGKAQSVRRVLYEAMHGPVPEGKEVARTCEHRNCVFHAEPQSHSKVGKRVAKTGVYANPARCAKIAATKRRDEARITWEQAQEMRGCSETLDEAAERYGISRTTVARIRRGQAWKDYSNPFSGLGARA